MSAPDPGSPAFQLEVYLIVPKEIGICYQGFSLRWSVLCEGACSCLPVYINTVFSTVLPALYFIMPCLGLGGVSTVRHSLEPGAIKNY